MLLGGGQEGGRRSGTESVLLIAGLGESATIVTRELPALQRHMAACTELLRELLVAELGGEVRACVCVFSCISHGTWN